MKAILSLFFLSVSATIFAVQAQTFSANTSYSEEPVFNEQNGEMVSTREFQYLGEQALVATYDPNEEKFNGINNVNNISSEIDKIRARGRVRCGSNLKVKSFAYKEDGVWHGIDADFCRVFAQAIIGDNSKIEMVNVPANLVVSALNNNRIDVMLSGAGYVAAMETAQKAVSAGVLYYDHQMVLARDDAADELQKNKDKKICLSTDTDYFQNFDNYNVRHNLGISYLSFNNLDKAKEAFLLNRCQMMTASGLMLNGILKDLPDSKAKILPELIALKPVYAFVQKDNTELRLAIKWILNALLLAEQHGINAQNLAFFASNDNQEIRNLLGDDETLWKNMGLNPQWLREAVTILGNYGDIFSRNLGDASDYHLKRREGRLVKDGGTVYPIPFL